jgi:hypothetical protein
MERSLEEARQRGWTPIISEAWKPAGPRCVLCGTASRWVRKDFLGFADIVALPVLAAIQTTTSTNLAARRTKILHECAVTAWKWLDAGGRILIWTWGEYVTPINGKHWRPTEEEITKTALRRAGYRPPRRSVQISLFTDGEGGM